MLYRLTVFQPTGTIEVWISMSLSGMKIELTTLPDIALSRTKSMKFVSEKPLSSVQNLRERILYFIFLARRKLAVICFVL